MWVHMCMHMCADQTVKQVWAMMRQLYLLMLLFLQLYLAHTTHIYET